MSFLKPGTGKMASDALNSINGQGRNDSGNASSDPTGDLALASYPPHKPSDEYEREEEYQKAIQALLDRTCGLVAEEEVGGLPAAKGGRQADDVRMAGPSCEAADPGEVDASLPGPSRATSTETTADIATLREVARSSARHALGLHRFQTLFSSARGKLVLATAALLTSLVAQVLAPRLPTAALAAALAAWIAGALWTVQYCYTTGQLSRLYLRTFADPEE